MRYNLKCPEKNVNMAHANPDEVLSAGGIEIVPGRPVFLFGPAASRAGHEPLAAGAEGGRGAVEHSVDRGAVVSDGHFVRDSNEPAVRDSDRLRPDGAAGGTDGDPRGGRVSGGAVDAGHFSGRGPFGASVRQRGVAGAAGASYVSRQAAGRAEGHPDREPDRSGPASDARADQILVPGAGSRRKPTFQKRFLRVLRFARLPDPGPNGPGGAGERPGPVCFRKRPDSLDRRRETSFGPIPNRRPCPAGPRPVRVEGQGERQEPAGDDASDRRPERTGAF